MTGPPQLQSRELSGAHASAGDLGDLALDREHGLVYLVVTAYATILLCSGCTMLFFCGACQRAADTHPAT